MKKILCVFLLVFPFFLSCKRKKDKIKSLELQRDLVKFDADRLNDSFRKELKKIDVMDTVKEKRLLEESNISTRLGELQFKYDSLQREINRLENK